MHQQLKTKILSIFFTIKTSFFLLQRKLIWQIYYDFFFLFIFQKYYFDDYKQQFVIKEKKNVV